ncbi:ribonuclease D [Candidatus Cytomitobacter primus]|uniref:3'-5' exonuclease domain-containing protein n=1 Tax=Candidatus Cytomitobacter primus TaxID=2066024 RepID=A0A5C0UGA3_9PROT|nr:HRDC domain-containing protein [Candidatus Cytomitobacter primus]QEK38760.1 hypothetical protein FZC34_02490 [Candidatus Cytomitobacter primus]
MNLGKNTFFIQTNDDLSNFEKEINKNPTVIYFDTEFYRRNTYWSQLCLMQIKVDNKIAMIDTQNVNIKGTFIADLFANSAILKVCHACEQDLSVLKHAEIPIENCFDTQIGAAFCKMGYGLSYQTLVSKLLDIELNKSYQDALWNKRPLTDEMLSYAKNDVLHLDQIFNKLYVQLDKTNRVHWVQEEVSSIKHNPKKKPMLHLWRDKLAQEKNLPPSWILNNKTLHALASETNIAKIKQMLPNKLQCYTQDVLDMINAAPKYKDLIDTNLHNILSILIKIIAESENIPASWLCNAENIRFICSNKKMPYKFGWRYDILQNNVHALLNGKIGIFYIDNKLCIIDL